MRRREFITRLGGALAAWPFAAYAQQSSPRLVGILSPLSRSAAASPPFAIFRKTLLDIGYVEGRAISLEYRWADGNSARLADFAAELVNLKVDVIFCGPGTPTVMAAKKATATIPIVFVGVGDVVDLGLVESLRHPGGNATGLVNELQDIAGKQMEVLKEAVPNLSRMGVLWRPSNPAYRNLIRWFDDVTRATGVEVVLISVETVADLLTAFTTMKKQQINGLLVQADELFIREGNQIVELAAAYKVPAIYRIGEQAAAGGFMAYGPDYQDMYREGALLVDKILKGARPADLPVEQPTKFELVINLKTANALGITVPTSLLVRADEVIE
ncbi:MAG TPA: ABC transporter substrate-binding protein [Xanthobacteraceae bacterium]|jgi:putative ABC transport system substrate-binding protein